MYPCQRAELLIAQGSQYIDYELIFAVGCLEHDKSSRRVKNVSRETLPIRAPFLRSAPGSRRRGRAARSCEAGIPFRAGGLLRPVHAGAPEQLHEVLTKRRGVCQDFAHLMIACLRSRGLAARYVSGYLRAAPPRSAGSGARPAIGAGASHAWVAVYTPPFGWLEFDPTNNVRVGTDHIAVAWGRDFGDVSPVHGVILGGATHELSVSVTVESITQ